MASCPGGGRGNLGGGCRWFGSSRGSGPQVVWHFRLWYISPHPPLQPFPRNGDVSCSGYVLFRGGASDNNKRKLNTEIGGQAESFPLVQGVLVDHENTAQRQYQVVYEATGFISADEFYSWL